MDDLDWKQALVSWADDYAARLAGGIGRGGVVIGGSIARNQHWEHSDLEIGVLVDELDPGLGHFSTDQGRGVETFQICRADLERQLDQVRGHDLQPVASWPLQLWHGRVTHDPSGLLSQFGALFDRHLFSSDVVALRLRAHRAALDQSLARATEMLDANRPRAALTLARRAMNELIQMAYWQHNQLPRSQNRTASRFRALAEEHGLAELYALFIDVFGLANLPAAIGDAWPECREEVLALCELVGGRPTREFFRVAVDSDFEWGEDDGIICVYRLYVPVMGAPDSGIFSKLDDHTWRLGHEPLLQFLGLEDPAVSVVSDLIRRLAEEVAP